MQPALYLSFFSWRLRASSAEISSLGPGRGDEEGAAEGASSRPTDCGLSSGSEVLELACPANRARPTSA